MVASSEKTVALRRDDFQSQRLGHAMHPRQACWISSIPPFM